MSPKATTPTPREWNRLRLLNSNLKFSPGYNAHPMGMLTAAFAALGTLHPEANPALAGQGVYMDMNVRNKQIARIIGNGPMIAAMAYRKREEK
jgi:citrate synthase